MERSNTVISTFTVALVAFFLFGTVGGYCQVAIGNEAQHVVSEEKKLSQNESYVQEFIPNSDSLKNALVERLAKRKRDENESDEVWFSSDPEDVRPLAGTKWEFSISYIFDLNRTLTFGTAIDTDSDGTVSISCSDQSEYPGAVFYTEFPPLFGGGFGYSIAILSPDIELYFFKLNGAEASGHYSLFANDFTYDMTGICLSNCDVDCAGILNGTAHVDTCGDCVGGNTGNSPCGNNANDDGGGGGGGCFMETIW